MKEYTHYIGSFYLINWEVKTTLSLSQPDLASRQ